MKYTMNLDSDLLDRVVHLTGSRTKTDAVMTALREVERRGRLLEVLRGGLGASEAELKDLFDPASDPTVSRAAEAKRAYRAKRR